MDDITLSFDEQALNLIVEKAIEYKLGARGLRSICEAIMLDAMFDIPSDENKKEAEHQPFLCPRKVKESIGKKLKAA